ncbi:DUF4885 family protein [Metabacillus sp. HB246100]
MVKNGFAYGYGMRNAIFRDLAFIYDGVEVAEQKAFNHQKVNEQFKQLMYKYQVKIPDTMKLTFTIDPSIHQL